LVAAVLFGIARDFAGQGAGGHEKARRGEPSGLKVVYFRER
jgi:hypothetical protein